MDAARCAKRLGAESVYGYRRCGQMPAAGDHHAKEEGLSSGSDRTVALHGDEEEGENRMR